MIGILLSLRLSKRVRELEASIAMIEELSLQIRYRALPVYELAGALESSKGLEPLRFIGMLNEHIEKERNFSIAWSNAIRSCKDQTNLKEDDVKILISVGNELGKSDIDGQSSTLSLYRDMLSRSLESAIEEKHNKGKMYRNLGALIGVGIAIILI